MRGDGPVDQRHTGRQVRHVRVDVGVGDDREGQGRVRIVTGVAVALPGRLGRRGPDQRAQGPGGGERARGRRESQEAAPPDARDACVGVSARCCRLVHQLRTLFCRYRNERHDPQRM
jgi:hypothetical protein